MSVSVIIAYTPFSNDFLGEVPEMKKRWCFCILIA